MQAGALGSKPDRPGRLKVVAAVLFTAGALALLRAKKLDAYARTIDEACPFSCPTRSPISASMHVPHGHLHAQGNSAATSDGLSGDTKILVDMWGSDCSARHESMTTFPGLLLFYYGYDYGFMPKCGVSWWKLTLWLLPVWLLLGLSLYRIAKRCFSDNSKDEETTKASQAGSMASQSGSMA